MKLRDGKFQAETVGLQLGVGGDGEHLIRDATCRGIQYGHADAMTALVRCGAELKKSPLSWFSVSVTKVTDSRRRQLDPRKPRRWRRPSCMAKSALVSRRCVPCA